MADEEVTLDGVTDSDGTAVVDGLREAIMADLEQTPTEGEPAATTDTPTPGATYTLADGTVVELDELEKGYLRQRDYTQKTQTLSQQRAEAEQALRLMQALTDNPVATLQALQANLLGADNEGDLDPYEQQLQAHEERFQQLEEQRFEAELNQVLSGLEAQYADRGFDRDAVVAWAVDNNIPNLRAAFLDMEEQRAADERRQADNQVALQRKQQLPPIGGRSRQLGGEAPAFREVHTARDAMFNALLELDAQP